MKLVVIIVEMHLKRHDISFEMLYFLKKINKSETSRSLWIYFKNHLHCNNKIVRVETID